MKTTTPKSNRSMFLIKNKLFLEINNAAEKVLFNCLFVRFILITD